MDRHPVPRFSQGVSSLGAQFRLYTNLLLRNNMGVKLSGRSRAVLVANFCDAVGAPPVGGAVGCLESSMMLCEANELFARNGAAAVYVGDESRGALVHRNFVCSDVAGIVVYNNSNAMVTENFVSNARRYSLFCHVLCLPSPTRD